MKSLQIGNMSNCLLRTRKLSDVEYHGGTVVYQMCRDIRAHDNDALLFAANLAKQKGGKLIVSYVIWNYLWEGATRRFYDWVIPSLKEVEKELRIHNIPLVISFENERMFTKKKFEAIPSHIGAVVIDELPLSFMRKWKELFLKHHKETSLYEVDAHNCIPVWEHSNKQEFAAHTIRNKVHRKVQDFLEPYDMLSKYTENDSLLNELKEINWEEVSQKLVCDESISGTGSFTPGSQAAQKMLNSFLEKNLRLMILHVMKLIVTVKVIFPRISHMEIFQEDELCLR